MGGVCHKKFLDNCIENFLLQNISEATHCPGHTLDLLPTDSVSTNFLNSWAVLPPMSSTCDHCIVSFTVTVDFVHSQNEPLLVPNFKKADFESIFSKLSSTNWFDIITTANGKV